MTLTVRTDRGLIPARASTRHVLARIVAPSPPRAERRAPVNVALVLDRSGSMAGQKIELARRAVELALRGLDVEDRFSLVVYDDRVDVVTPSTAATGDAKREALERLAEFDARGTTNLAEGWLRGCEQVAAAQRANGVNRVLLLTDGLANVGITDPAKLAGHAAELRRRGIATSTFGVGGDFDEALLATIAEAAGGNFYVVADERQIPDYLASELGEVLEVVARDARLEVEPPLGSSVTGLSHPATGHEGLWSVALGDLIGGQELDVVLALRFEALESGPAEPPGVEVRFLARSEEGPFAGPAQVLEWHVAIDDANDRQPVDGEVERAVALVEAAWARREATERNRAGDYAAATRQLRELAERMGRRVAANPGLSNIVAELDRDAGLLSGPMAPVARKEMYFAASNALRSRDARGRSRRVNPED